MLVVKVERYLTFICNLLCSLLTACFYFARGSSPDGISQPYPTTEAVKALNSLESLINSKHYQELRTSVELAMKLVTDPNNSLHNASYILGVLATDLFQQQYLSVLKVSVTICDVLCFIVGNTETKEANKLILTLCH
jgi:hypothetical protein